MSDINSFANDLLLDFLDECHDFLRAELTQKYGDEWFRKGVEPVLDPGYVEKTRRMLSSPMRVIDMEKSDDEIYGVEHLANIIEKNWLDFSARFEKLERTRLYLQEMSELRHNVSHRRKHHYLRRDELIRFVQNARMLLRAMGSSLEPRFNHLAESLSLGSTPWGTQLSGQLPPADEIVREFVGRPDELHQLSVWLADPDARQMLLWGYGGAGKTAIAYQFAREAREAAPIGMHAVIWVSAKRIEFIEGAGRERPADFHDLDSLVTAFWRALYGVAPEGSSSPAQVLAELKETPSLLVIDDLDTVLEDEALSNFVLYQLRSPDVKVLYTSRQRVPGMRTIEVRGFVGDELKKFIAVRSRSHGLDVDECVRRADAIHSVTGGFPLFVDDLLRQARLDGLKFALESWSQRRGDAAREYALRRQLEKLGEPTRDVLVAVAVAGRPVSKIEAAGLVGFTDDDVDQAIHALLDWKLVNLVAAAGGEPNLVGCNLNTQRLVLKTYGRSPRADGFRAAFRALTGASVPHAMYAAIARAISDARQLVLRGDVEGAADVLRQEMTGELASAPDLWGALGWVRSRGLKDVEAVDEARAAFQRAHDLGSRKEDTYFHWAQMELNQAGAALEARMSEESLVGLWRAAARIADLGIERCGPTQWLCNTAAYARTREAKTLERLRRFTSAQSAYAQAESHARAGLRAPSSDRFLSASDQYRSLIIALEGQDAGDSVLTEMKAWRDVCGRDDLFRSERERLLSRFPQLAEV